MSVYGATSFRNTCFLLLSETIFIHVVLPALVFSYWQDNVYFKTESHDVSVLKGIRYTYVLVSIFVDVAFML